MKPCLKTLILVASFALMACGKPQPQTAAPSAPNMRFAYLQNATAYGVTVPEARPCQADPNWKFADTPAGEEILFIAPNSMVCAAFPENMVTAHFVALKLQGRQDDRPVGIPLRIDRGNVCGGAMDLRSLSAQLPVEIAANCQAAKQ